MSFIRLSLAGFSIEFSKFLNDQVPRVDPTDNSLQYSAYGTPGVTGRFYELPHLWNVDAYCSLEDYQNLLVIFAESDRRRRANLDWRINLDDTTLPFVELSPRTRAIVSGESETTISGSVDYVSYFARYKVWIVKRPDFRRMGGDWGVSFTCQEAGKFEA